MAAQKEAVRAALGRTKGPGISGLPRLSAGHIGPRRMETQPFGNSLIFRQERRCVKDITQRCAEGRSGWGTGKRISEALGFVHVI